MWTFYYKATFDNATGKLTNGIWDTGSVPSDKKGTWQLDKVPSWYLDKDKQKDIEI